jgi:prepilin-type N-terminal cleavage/methylation domain-containing protein
MDRQFLSTGSRKRVPPRGVTLIELLCVITIISILISLLMPAVSRAYQKAKAMSDEVEAPEIADLVITASRNYCTVVTNYRFESKSDFATKCVLPPKGRDWVTAGRTEFAPFGCQDSASKVVLVFHYGRNNARSYHFTAGQLSRVPP